MDRTLLAYFLHVLGFVPAAKPVVVTASRDLTAADAGKVLTYNDPAAAITLNVPTGLPAGFSVTIVQAGVGVVTVGAGAGVTVGNFSNQTKTAGQNACVELRQSGADAYVLFGQTAA